MPADLRTITDFEELIAYLRDELNWPVEDYKLDQLTFEYDADELGLKDEEAEKLKDGTIRQLRPLPGGQPLGIFFVEFGQAKLPVVVLRRILNALVIKKRNSANPADRQRWDAADILFISAFGESDDREIAFAHFHKDPDTTELPILRVLGWDGSDTPLKTKHVAEVLKNRLHWPENAADQDAWRKQWRGAFRHRLGHVIKTSSDLADALAHFARKIRDAASPAAQKKAWNDYVPKHLLPRLHGYELMMAPYAIAHMKIGLKLAATGYQFGTEERARIYLTNALEKPDDRQTQLIGFDALAHEAAAVNEIKRHKRFSVVIGNPPYTVMSANLSDASRALIEAYRFANGERLKEKSMLRLEMHLQDDYIKFFRISEQAISATGAGILGLISNHSFLNNPTLRGMRWNLLQTFSTLHVFDLHGNPGRKDAAATEPDENVFDILQGVAISVMAKVPSRPAGMKLVRADLTGERTAKYKKLAQSSAQSTQYKTVDACAPFYLFTVQDAELRSEYCSGASLVSAMPTNSVGIVTGRDGFATDITEQVLRNRIEIFCDSSRGDSEIRKLFDIRDAGGYMLSKRRKFVVGKSAANFIHRVTYRPFDYRWIAYSRGFLTSDQKNVMRHILPGGNIALVTARSNKSASMDHFFCSKNVTETKCGESTTQSCVFPLYTISDDGLALTEGPCPNFSKEFLRDLAAKLSLSVHKSTGLPAGLTPEDIFHYAYAVFHSPGYRGRYSEFLKIDFPRLPLTGDLDLFRALARLGGEITTLHLLESPLFAQPISAFIGSSHPEVEKPSWSDDTVWIDKKQTIGFQGVPDDVWNFQIGGYQVCHKWLKDRKGRTLTAEDIAHYHKIVVALTETIRLMAEIDEIIETHGGWPAAFHSTSTK